MEILSSTTVLQEWGSNTLAIACFAAFCVGMAKGGVPTIGMLAVPVMALIMPPLKGAAILLPIFILTDMISVWLYRHHFSRPNLKILIPAGLIGVIIGWATASIVSERFVSLMIGTLGLGFCCYFVIKQRFFKKAQSVSILKGSICGILSGFTSFISHAGSPPYQVYMLPQRLDKLTFIGTTTLTFAIINLAKIWPYATLLPYQKADFTLAACLIPTALAGVLAGRFLVYKLHEAWFFALIQIGLFLISIKLITQSF